MNHSTGEVCDIEFKPRGWSAQSAHVISGAIRASAQSQQILIKIEGKTSEGVKMVDLRIPENQQKEVDLWTPITRPENYEWMYHFSKYALQLNMISD